MVNCLGERMAHLRKYLRISQTLIGKDILGRTRQYYADMEKGKRAPSPFELKTIAILFCLPGFDTSYLTSQEKFDEICNFKLKTSSAAKKFRGSDCDPFDQREVNMLQEETDNYFQRSKVEQPIWFKELIESPLPPRMKMEQMNKALEKKLNFDITKDNVFLLPSYLGIYLVFTAMSKLSGASVKTEEGNYGILINSNQIFSRQRFNLLHEIAHVGLGHLEEVTIMKSKLGRSFDPVEVEADTFAADVLMPEQMIFTMVKGARNYAAPEFVKSLADHFNVSYLAMVTRMKSLGFLSQEDKEGLQKVKPSMLESSKKLKIDADNIEEAKKVTEQLMKQQTEGLKISSFIASPRELRNFQEGIYTHVNGVYSARLIYEQVANVLLNWNLSKLTAVLSV